MRQIFYTLFEGEAYPCSADEASAMLRDIELRRVAFTRIGIYEVSTVFLVFDRGFHEFEGSAPPLLFETAVFAGTDTAIIARYATLDLAKAGHKEVVAEVGRASGQAPAEAE